MWFIMLFKCSSFIVGLTVWLWGGWIVLWVLDQLWGRTVSLPPGGVQYFIQLFVANWLLDVSILMLQRQLDLEMLPLYHLTRMTRKGRFADFLYERIPPHSAYVMGVVAVLWYCTLLGAIISFWL